MSSNNIGQRVITLCGSTRFKEDHLREARRLTLEGNIVLSLPFYSQSDDDLKLSDKELAMLEKAHLCKIDMADSIHVINTGGYIGESTMREIRYAVNTGKSISYMITPPANKSIVTVIGNMNVQLTIKQVAAALESEGHVTIINVQQMVDQKVPDAQLSRRHIDMANEVYIVYASGIPNEEFVNDIKAYALSLGKTIKYIRCDCDSILEIRMKRSARDFGRE